MHRITALAIAAAFAVSVAGPVAAATSPNGCANYGAIVPFTVALPDSIRSTGTHGYEFMATWSGGSDVNANTVTFDPAAPLYPDTAWVRPFYIQVLLPDGSVSVDVTTLNPTQTARFGIAYGTIRSDTSFNQSLQAAVRWETSPGTWSAWTALPKGPVTSICAPGGVNHYGGYFKEAWGWAG